MFDGAYWGYIGALVASVFFGSNYVPVKGYNTGNGIAFQWFMCSGILICGFVTMGITHDDKPFFFDWKAILGGGAWAIGNSLSMPCISLIGLGLGILTWSSTNLVFGYIWGRVGAFGLKKEEVENEVFSIMGVVFAVVALFLFFFIKPTLENNRPKELSAPDDEYQQFRQAKMSSVNQDAPPSDLFRIDEYPSSAEIPWLTNTDFYRDFVYLLDNSPNGKRFLGIGMAIVSGLCYSVSLVPFQLWNNDSTKTTLRYCFSQFGGIYIVSTIIFLTYSVIVRPPRMNIAATLPSYLSGVLWGIAAAGWMLSTGKLGFTVGYPISAVGPLIVSSLWSVLWFREIQGAKNLILLAIAFGFIFIAIAFLVLSNEVKL